MDEGTKRSLRNRRPPNYLVAECQDLEALGYARSNFAKEYVSPALELNSAAKLLARFINSANKRTQSSISDLTEKMKIVEAEEKLEGASSLPNPEKPSRKATTTQEGSRKKQNSKSDYKDDGSKMSRDLYSFKDQHNQQGPNRDSNRAPDASRNKGTSRTEKQIRGNNPLSAQYAALLNQINSQHKNTLGLTAQNHLQAANKAIMQQQMYLNSSPLFQQKLQQPQPQPIAPSPAQGSRKLFKRASYHVAIAYHIHLKKVQEKGGDIQKELDPTYQAKKLRNDQENDQNVNGA